MDLGISGKWALVCGASKGLGLGCAKALVAEGVNVVIVARGQEALEVAAKDLKCEGSGQVVPISADITSETGRQAVLHIRRDFDILITNAGGPPPGDFRSWQRDDWLKAIDANMLTPISLITSIADGMADRGFGRILNITSSAVKAPIDILGLSNGARSGLTGFVAGVARQKRLAERNVTINNVLPGAFDTDRLRGTLKAAADKQQKSFEETWDARRKTIPAQRFGNAEEFGQVCAFLCSVQAGYITGQNILLDGGAFPGTF